MHFAALMSKTLGAKLSSWEVIRHLLHWPSFSTGIDNGAEGNSVLSCAEIPRWLASCKTQHKQQATAALLHIDWFFKREKLFGISVWPWRFPMWNNGFGAGPQPCYIDIFQRSLYDHITSPCCKPLLLTLWLCPNSIQFPIIYCSPTNQHPGTLPAEPAYWTKAHGCHLPWARLMKNGQNVILKSKRFGMCNSRLWAGLGVMSTQWRFWDLVFWRSPKWSQSIILGDKNHVGISRCLAKSNRLHRWQDWFKSLQLAS